MPPGLRQVGRYKVKVWLQAGDDTAAGNPPV
jgi:hypothetical protein